TGVAITGVVRDHLPERAGAATGLYTVAMMAGATVASLTALPFASWLGGWSGSLAVWSLPAAPALGGWVPVARRLAGSDGPRAAGRRRRRPRSPSAWPTCSPGSPRG